MTDHNNNDTPLVLAIRCGIFATISFHDTFRVFLVQSCCKPDFAFAALAQWLRYLCFLIMAAAQYQRVAGDESDDPPRYSSRVKKWYQRPSVRIF
jgi:hypothetical protein